MPRQKLAPQPLTFKVVFERDGDGWHVRIPSVQGCHTWGRSIQEARRNLREALACCVDVFGSDVAADRAAEEAVLDEHYPAAVAEELLRYARAQAKAKEAKEAALVSARALTERVSLRDTGALLGMSAEGVRKLVLPKGKEKRARQPG